MRGNDSDITPNARDLGTGAISDELCDAMDNGDDAKQISPQHCPGKRLDHMEPQYVEANNLNNLIPCDSEDPETLVQDQIQGLLELRRDHVYHEFTLKPRGLVFCTIAAASAHDYSDLGVKRIETDVRAPVVGDSSRGLEDPLQSSTLSQAHVNGVGEMGASVSAGPPSSPAGEGASLPGGVSAPLLENGEGGGDPTNTARYFPQQYLFYRPMLNINMKLCLACASDEVVAQHPLFPGGLCHSCKVNYVLAVYLFDGGYHSYCAVCGRGKEIVMCESSNCWRVFCTCCMDRLLGLGTARTAKSSSFWKCYMCRPLEASNQLSLHDDWALRLRDLIVSEGAVAEEFQQLYPPLPPRNKAAVRVVTFFDDPSAASIALSDFNNLMDCHVRCGLKKKDMTVSTMTRGKYICLNVSSLTQKCVNDLGPFTLVLGGHCLLDSDTGETLNHFFYEFFHLLKMTRSRHREPLDRPFFWLFTVLEAKCFGGPINNQEISRFLAMSPVEIIYSRKQVTCYMWGNLPCLDRICDFYRDVDLEPSEVSQVNIGKTWYLAYSALRRALAPLRDYFSFEASDNS